jgi:hypothetical protein
MSGSIIDIGTNGVILSVVPGGVDCPSYSGQLLVVRFEGHEDVVICTGDQYLTENQNIIDDGAFLSRNEMSFHEMTQSFLEGFETYLIKDGCSGNTIHHYMRTIRALFYRAVKADYATPELNPFYSNYTRKGYRFSHLLKATSKRALSKADLQKLIRYQPV